MFRVVRGFTFTSDTVVPRSCTHLCPRSVGEATAVGELRAEGLLVMKFHSDFCRLWNCDSSPVSLRAFRGSSCVFTFSLCREMVCILSGDCETIGVGKLLAGRIDFSSILFFLFFFATFTSWAVRVTSLQVMFSLTKSCFNHWDGDAANDAVLKQCSHKLFKENRWAILLNEREC